MTDTDAGKPDDNDLLRRLATAVECHECSASYAIKTAYALGRNLGKVEGAKLAFDTMKITRQAA